MGYSYFVSTAYRGPTIRTDPLEDTMNQTQSDPMIAIAQQALQNDQLILNIGPACAECCYLATGGVANPDSSPDSLAAVLAVWRRVTERDPSGTVHAVEAGEPRVITCSCCGLMRISDQRMYALARQ